jgi:hypothetical protein
MAGPKKEGDKGKLLLKRPCWTVNNVPSFYGMSDRSGNHISTLMSIPEYSRLINPYKSINETRYESVYVMLKDPKDKDAIKKLNDEI